MRGSNERMRTMALLLDQDCADKIMALESWHLVDEIQRLIKECMERISDTKSEEEILIETAMTKQLILKLFSKNKKNSVSWDIWRISFIINRIGNIHLQKMNTLKK